MKKTVMFMLFISQLFVLANADDGEAIYKRSCAACHDYGSFNAPRLGDRQEWAPRISKGIVILTHNAVEGFAGSKGLMPAKGGDLSLTEAEVRSAVQYIIDKSW